MSDPIADGAIAALIECDAAAPLDAAGLSDLVGRLSKAGRDAEASAFAARLLRARPGHRRALRALARAPAPGVDVAGGWRALAAADASDIEPWLQLARLAAREKDWAALLEACDALLARAAGHPEGLARRVAALVALGRPDAAAETWTRLAAAEAPRARDALARAIAGPDLDAKAAILGAALTAGPLDGAEARAADEFLRGLRAQAESAARDANATAEVAALWRIARLVPSEEAARAALDAGIARLGAELAAAGPAPPPRLAAAARTLARANPSRSAFRALGRIAAQSLAWGEASDAFRRALAVGGETAAEDASLWLELAEACARRGRMDEALEALDHARGAAAKPTRLAEVETLLRGLADAGQRAAFDREDAPTAARLLEALLALGVDPGRLADRHARLTRLIGRKMNEAAEARAPETIELARLLLARLPDDERAWLILGRALLRERRDGEAVEVWERIAADRRGDAEPSLQLARLGKRLNRADLGAPAARRVLSIDPGHAEARALLAQFEVAPVGA